MGQSLNLMESKICSCWKQWSESPHPYHRVTRPQWKPQFQIFLGRTQGLRETGRCEQAASGGCLCPRRGWEVPSDIHICRVSVQLSHLASVGSPRAPWKSIWSPRRSYSWHVSRSRLSLGDVSTCVITYGRAETKNMEYVNKCKRP